MSGTAQDGERALDLLRRLDAVTGNRGHALNVVKPADVDIVKQANADNPSDHQRSLRCWGCSLTDDQPTNPYHEPDGPTWGDQAHERNAVWMEIRALLDAFANGGPGGPDA